MAAVVLQALPGCPEDEGNYYIQWDDDVVADDDVVGDDDSTADDDASVVDADGDGYVEGEDCDDSNPGVHPDAGEACNGIDDDCDGLVDNGVLGSDAACLGPNCWAILQSGSASGDGLYWIDPDGDLFDPRAAWCDMTADGGGWTKLFSAAYPTWWSDAAWETAGDPSDADYSMLDQRTHFLSEGAYTLRFEVGRSGSWDTTPRDDYTIWSQEHDPFTESTHGADYAYIDGSESSYYTCGYFNGFHHRHYVEGAVSGLRHAMASDVDADDSSGCWGIQVVPILVYSNYTGYLDSYYGTTNAHLWQVLWAR